MHTALRLGLRVADRLRELNPAVRVCFHGLYAQLNQGASKIEALRRAKLAMLRSPRASWHHPYYWAAFTLDGLAD
jgi:hypothetical protein